MDPKDYDAREWTELARQLNQRQLRNALKQAYRRVAKDVRQIGLKDLRATGMNVRGNRADWEKGLRAHVYTKGGGFKLTVKPHGDKGVHLNRRGKKKPVLMWASEGTRRRNIGKSIRSEKGRSRYSGATVRRYIRQGHSTGAMPNYGFLDKSQPEMYRKVEADLGREVEQAVGRVAKKCGFV